MELKQKRGVCLLIVCKSPNLLNIYVHTTNENNSYNERNVMQHTVEPLSHVVCSGSSLALCASTECCIPHYNMIHSQFAICILLCEKKEEEEEAHEIVHKSQKMNDSLSLCALAHRIKIIISLFSFHHIKRENWSIRKLLLRGCNNGR